MIMEKDFKQAIEQSTKAMKELEAKVEDIAGELSESASKLWSDFRANFADMDSKLNKASEDFSKAGDETTLQAHLGAMEAREKMESMKDDVSDFTLKVAESAETAFDTATLRAHLGKMDAEDFWESKGKGITEEFSASKENVEKLAVEAIDEITNFFGKLVEEFNDKKKS
jgi:methyl-accepting chemotaxis protein